MPELGAAMKVALGMILCCSLGFGHVRWTTPTPRVNENIKVGPCGAPPGNPVVSYAPGSRVQVTFDEFINHSGFFGFAVACKSNPTAADFTSLPSPVPLNGTNPYPMYLNPAIHMLDTRNGGTQMVTITLPNTTCPNAVLQIIQYMMDAGANTPPSLYYSCADIRLGTGGITPPPTDSQQQCRPEL